MMEYQEITELQKDQLLHQSYLSTQQVQLAVWSESMGRYLKRSLKRQIHQNFFCIASPEEMPSECSGVIVVTDDVDCMSTTLMQYAAALSAGADFVYSDILFGPSGEILCTPTPAQSGVAAISLALFQWASGEDKEESPASVLHYAASRAQNLCRLPYALIQFRRDPQITDLFRVKRKKALLLTNEYSMTGAPIVLSNTVPILKANGYDVVVLGPEAAGAQRLFEQAGAYVVYHQRGLAETGLCSVAQRCDVIILNTVVCAKQLHLLNGLPIPVLWWLHDAYQVYYGVAPELPEQLAENVRVCAVGEHARQAMLQLRPEFEVRELLYGLPDYSQDEPAELDLSFADGKLLFVAIGTLERRKGINILCKAISLLNAEARNHVCFLFVGRNQGSELFAELCSAMERFPDQVHYREQLSRDEIKALLRRADCMVCASRDDPMPTCITEGFIFGKPAIVSEHTGTAKFVQKWECGVVYENDDPVELAHCIERFAARPDQLPKMGEKGRALYEAHFSEHAFEEKFSTFLAEIERSDF